MGINVMSLFDGMSCGQIALDQLGIKVIKYYASEIEPNAINITKKNYPNTIHIGDVKKIDGTKYKNIDLLIGGSPCQNLSIAVINNINCNQGLGGAKSMLFYEYLRLYNEIKPNYFLLENVGSMTNVNRDIISLALGVAPIKIDSNLVSAQDRIRYYWTNIPCKKLPENRHIYLKDIIEPSNNVPDKYWYKCKFKLHNANSKVIATLDIKGHDILKRVYNPMGKCGTLTKVSGGSQQKKVYQNGKCRKLMPIEYERLQTVPDNYTDGISDNARYNMLGNGWTVEVIKHIFKGIERR